MPWRVAVALLGVLSLAACGHPERKPGDLPLRIVSLLPAATETLYALGAGERVVARCAYCDWPPAVLELPAVGDAVSVHAERVMALAPDLVLVGSGAQAEALGAIGEVARIEVVKAETVADARRILRQIAEWTGREEAGEALVRRIDDALASARSRHEPGSGPRALFVVQREPLIVAGAGSYVNDLLLAVGASNVAGDIERPWPDLSLETLVARDPELILDADLVPGASGEAFWRRFVTLTAVRNGRVVPVAEPAILRPGPRLPLALEVLERLVWEGGK